MNLSFVHQKCVIMAKDEVQSFEQPKITHAHNLLYEQ